MDHHSEVRSTKSDSFATSMAEEASSAEDGEGHARLQRYCAWECPLARSDCCCGSRSCVRSRCRYASGDMRACAAEEVLHRAAGKVVAT